MALPPVRRAISCTDYYNRRYNCRTKPLSNESMSVLQKYQRPGNIRELADHVEAGMMATYTVYSPSQRSCPINLRLQISGKRLRKTE